MLTTILSLVGAAGTIAAGVLAYKNSANRQRRNAEKDVEKIDAEKQAKRDEIRQAVYSNDDAKINELASRLLTPCVFAFLSASILVGCAAQNRVVYIPTDRRIESCTNSLGVACKMVPNAVFCELLEKAQELADMKKEKAVENRLSK